MDCRRFEEELFGAEALSAPMREHVGQCRRCAELLHSFDLRDKEVESLVLDVLRHTTGDTCAVAHDRLCETVDAAGSPDAALRSHLEACGDCAALYGALRVLPRDLAALAWLEPDADFVADVLARTSERPTPARWLQALLMRPRLALEGAYLATALAALLLGPSVTALARTPQQAVAQFREIRVQGGQVAGAALDRVATSGGDAIEQSRQRADEWLAETSNEAAARLADAVARLDAFWNRLRGQSPQSSDPYDGANGGSAA